jgi:hypothetical protein
MTYDEFLEACEMEIPEYFCQRLSGHCFEDFYFQPNGMLWKIGWRGVPKYLFRLEEKHFWHKIFLIQEYRIHRTAPLETIYDELKEVKL